MPHVASIFTQLGGGGFNATDKLGMDARASPCPWWIDAGAWKMKMWYSVMADTSNMFVKED